MTGHPYTCARCGKPRTSSDPNVDDRTVCLICLAGDEPAAPRPVTR